MYEYNYGIPSMFDSSLWSVGGGYNPDTGINVQVGYSGSGGYGYGTYGQYPYPQQQYPAYQQYPTLNQNNMLLFALVIVAAILVLK